MSRMRIVLVYSPVSTTSIDSLFYVRGMELITLNEKKITLYFQTEITSCDNSLREK